MSSVPTRIVNDSMLGLSMPDSQRWSDLVVTVLGQNPGMFTGPGTNTYLLGRGRELILLDTGQGLAQYTDLLEAALAEHCGGARIVKIVVTHAHGDHLGGVPALLDRFGDIPLWKMPWPEQDLGLAIDPLADGDECALEDLTLRALWTPGHARDHLCFYMPEEKALFTGDVVLGAGTTVIPPDGDLGDYMASLRRLLELDIEVIYPAHGPAIDDPRRKIEDYIAHRLLRDRQILEGLAAGLDSIRALVERIYTDVPSFLHDAAAASVEAHLRKLDAEGRVRCENGRWFAA